MSRDIRQYWQSVRAMEETLPEFVWLAAGNAITEAPASIAAKLLHAGSHRVATEEEIASQRDYEKNAAKQARHDRMRRAGQAVVVIEEAETESPEALKSGPSRRRRR